MEHVTLTAPGLDMARQIGVYLDLAPQPQHQHVDVSVDITVALRTQPVENLGTADGLVGRLGKNFQKREFGARQCPAAVREADSAACIKINRPVPKPQRRARPWSRSLSFSCFSEGIVRRRTALIRAVSSIGSKGLTT